jgi:hypothetical protein
MFAETRRCPHCGGDVQAMLRTQARAVATAENAVAASERMLGPVE